MLSYVRTTMDRAMSNLVPTPVVVGPRGVICFLIG